MDLNSLPREEFVEKIIDDWAAYFDVSPGTFAKSGSSYLHRENYAANRVIIAHVDQHSFVQYNPDVDERIQSFAKQCPGDLTVTADHLVSYFENENIQIECLDNMYYLYPADLTAWKPDKSFTVRKLAPEDEGYLEELNGACLEEEVENSFVAVDELGAWGCFKEDKLVAATGYSDWGLYADFGVITHPSFRKQGLAKEVVSAACQEAIGIGKIPIYRCHITLFPSINTAKAVGFKKYSEAYFKMEVLKFMR